MAEDTNPYLQLMQSEEDRRKVQAGATLADAITTNPDEYAKQKRTAGYLGVPPAAVAATPDESQAEAQLKQITANTAKHPALQQRYTNADFAKLAHDDSDTLGKIGDWVSATTRYVMGADNGRGLPQDFSAGVFKLSRGAAGQGRAVSETLAPFLDVLEPATAIGGNPLRRLAEGFELRGERALQAADAATRPGEGIIEGGVSSGVQSLVANVLMLPLALLPGGQPAALAGLSSSAGGQSYLDARAQGVPVVRAVPYALSQAAIEYATEKIPLQRLIGDVQVGAGAFKTLAHQIAAEVPGEQLATVLQDMNDWATLPANADKPFSAYVAERPSAAAQTLIATVIGVGGNVAVMTGVQQAVDAATGYQRRVDQSAQDTENLQELFKLAAASKLREREPQQLADLVQELAEGTEGAPSEVYVDARILAGEGGLLNQEQIAELLPSVAPQLAEALATGGDVAIPIGELAARVAGTPLEEKLLEHLRLAPDALSQAEATQAGDLAGEYLQKEAERLTAQAENAQAAQTSAEVVKGLVLEQLNTANRFTPQVNDAYASLVRDFYTVTGGRLGLTAEQMFQAYPLRIASVNPATADLTQAAYHGTAYRGIERFTTEKIGTGEGAQVYGWGLYFAKSRQIAEFYRKTVAEQRASDDHDYFNASMNLTLELERKGKLPVGTIQGDLTDADLLALARAEMPDAPETRAFEREFAKHGTGQLYEVEVPGDDVLLDREAQLKDQPEAVRKALESLGFANEKVIVRDPSGKTLAEFATMDMAKRAITSQNLDGKPVRVASPLTGKDIYTALSRKLGGDRAASEALAKAGVPGLRYFDANSRSDSAVKSHNYVIFRDDAVQITGEFYQSRVKQATPAVTKLLKNLTPSEQTKITDRMAEKVIGLMKDLPSAKEMAAVAYAGRAKRGWYAKSADTISQLFGADAPRFASLLAAQSPQCSVETNLVNTLNTWKNWTAAGRPTDRAEIVRIMGRSVEGSRGEASVLEAWINNSVRSLTADAPDEALLSGPKVNSFFKNLRGHVQEVTNDAWMANYALVSQTLFGGVGINKAGTDPGKGSGYLAMNARVREAAATLTKLTGETWTPAEVQETIWSWAKSLYELANQAGEDRTARQIVEERGLSDELINSTPDFGTLFHNPTYAKILKEAGYGEELRSIAERNAADAAVQVPRTQGQASPFAEDTQLRYELAAARRLDRLAAARGDARAAAADDEDVNAALAEAGGVYEQAARRAPTLNIGLATNASGPVTPESALAAIEAVGGRVVKHSIHDSDTEPTLVAQLAAPLTPEQVNQAAVSLGQEAIAQHDGQRGALYGPEAAKWGAFNPDFFLTLDGSRMSDAAVYAQGMPGEPLEIEEPLRGLLQTVQVDGQDVTFGPFVPARVAAAQYMEAAGLPFSPPTTYAKADPERGARIARAFTRMIHDPKDPKVKASYDAMIQETQAQYRAILATGLKVEFNDGADPYGNPRKAILDVVHNNHLWVFSTREGFGSDASFDPVDNPLLAETEFTDANGKPMLANDVFRVVHDYFGHIKEGVGFRADGEENAWRAHAAMYSDLARPAMTTETRGQNSWVNFGPQALANAKANGADTIYADQKIGLLPEWVLTEGLDDGTASGRTRDAASADDGGRGGPQTVVRQEGGRVDVRGVHYSTAQRARLDGRFYGRGLKGAERARLDLSDDRRIKDRVYLYVDEGNGIRPESGVGAVAHDVDAVNLYDINANPLKLPTGDANAMESAILDAGFDGYYVPKVFNAQGVAVILGNASHNVAVNVPPPLEQGPRGTFSPTALRISLLEGADLSTFLHETGHFFLEVMADVASQTTAPADVQQDMAKVLKWFEIKAGDNKSALDTWRAMSLDEKRPFHEKFAEAFEHYLFEGKAPSAELQPLFARFRSWMTNVYKSITEFLRTHDTQLTPTVRGVFDRLLASEAAIAEAEQARAYAPLFKDAAEAGMTTEEWAAYQAAGQKATDDAVAKLEKRSLADMRWSAKAHARALRDAQRDVADKRKTVEVEVTAEVADTPVEKARAYLAELQKKAAAGSKEHKAERKAWSQKYASAALTIADEVKADAAFPTKAERKLEVERRMLGWEVANPAPLPEVSAQDMDVVAEMFGFTSGDELARTIAAAPAAAELIEAKTDQRLLERFGDITSAAAMQRAADEAVHNEARGRFIATGLAALMNAGKQSEKAPGEKRSTNVIVQAAKTFAGGLVARKKVRDVRPAHHLAAEGRAGKQALAAMASGDTQLAIAAQRDQLLNHYAARYSAEAVTEVEKRVAWLRKFETNTTLPPEYRDQIDKLLERYDLRKVPLKTVDKRASLLEWVESQRAIGVEPELPPGLLNEAQRQNYRDMTVEQFRGLVDAVKQIEHLGRLKNKLLTAKDQRDFETTRDAIAESITRNAGKRVADTRTPTTNLGRALQGMRNFGAAHIKAATWARILDGGKDGGPMWETFVRSANERADQETTQRAEATKALVAILAPLFDSGKLGGKGVYFPSVKRSFNRESLLAIALNTGNEGNLQRLLGGEGWTMEQLRPLLDSLSAADWATVQKVWDYFESYRPAIGAKSLRVYGTEPEWIEPAPRKQMLPDGTEIVLKGGYFPIKYDPAASVRAEEHADAEGAKRQLQGAYGAATTRRSFTKARAEEVVGRPLLYTLAGLYSGVNDVIHDLAWHEWLIDTNRLLKSQAIDSAIRSHYGPAAVRQLKSWRDAVAEGESGATEALDMALGRLRQGVSVAGLGFNLMSALMQPLGITQSIVRVGPQWVGKGLMQYLGNPVRATAEVHEQSEFMANRARTRFRELNELRNQVQGENTVQATSSKWAYFLMMQLQQMVDVPTWLGAYERAVADGNDDARAIDLADQAVIDSQGGGQVKDLSAIERGGPAQKLFTVFYSFMNTALNLGVASKMGPDGQAKFAANMVLLYVVPAVFGSLLKSALTPGDSGDDDWKALGRKLIGEQIAFLMGLMVVTREFSEAAKTVAGVTDYPRDYAGPAGVRVIADAGKAAKQAQQGEFDDSFRKAVINLVGSLAGLPAAQVNRSITGAKALAEGKTKNPAALALGYEEPR
jgi:hypothetical protein